MYYAIGLFVLLAVLTMIAKKRFSESSRSLDRRAKQSGMIVDGSDSDDDNKIDVGSYKSKREQVPVRRTHESRRIQEDVPRKSYSDIRKAEVTPHPSKGYLERGEKNVPKREHVEFTVNSFTDIKNIPNNVTILKLGINFDFPLDIVNLKSLEVLNVNDNFNNRLDRLPDNLQEIIFNDTSCFNNVLILPKNLRKLRLGFIFNKQLGNSESLEELHVGKLFQQRLGEYPNLRKFIHHKGYPFTTEYREVIIP